MIGNDDGMCCRCSRPIPTDRWSLASGDTIIVKHKFDDMTAHLEFGMYYSSERSDRLMAYTSFMLYRKRKAIDSQWDTITGNGNMAHLLWARSTILAAPQFIFLAVREADRLTMLIQGSDSRRRKAYEKVFSRHGYKSIRIPGEGEMMARSYHRQEVFGEHAKFCTCRTSMNRNSNTAPKVFLSGW